MFPGLRCRLDTRRQTVNVHPAKKSPVVIVVIGYTLFDLYQIVKELKVPQVPLVWFLCQNNTCCCDAEFDLYQYCRARILVVSHVQRQGKRSIFRRNPALVRGRRVTDVFSTEKTGDAPFWVACGGGMFVALAQKWCWLAGVLTGNSAAIPAVFHCFCRNCLFFKDRKIWHANCWGSWRGFLRSV